MRSICERYVGKPCGYCNTPMDRSKWGRPTRDHIIPRVHGGTFLGDGNEWNKIVVCAACNHDKAHLTLEGFWMALSLADDPRSGLVALLIRKLVFNPAYLRGEGIDWQAKHTRRTVWVMLDVDRKSHVKVPPPYRGKVVNPVLDRPVMLAESTVSRENVSCEQHEAAE